MPTERSDFSDALTQFDFRMLRFDMKSKTQVLSPLPEANKRRVQSELWQNHILQMTRS